MQGPKVHAASPVGIKKQFVVERICAECIVCRGVKCCVDAETVLC